MLAFLWSCVVLSIKVAIGTLTISCGIFIIGLILGLIVMAISELTN